jgi:hypothetical protein
MEVASKLFPRQPDSAIKQTIQICNFFKDKINLNWFLTEK